MHAAARVGPSILIDPDVIVLLLVIIVVSKCDDVISDGFQTFCGEENITRRHQQSGVRTGRELRAEIIIFLMEDGMEGSIIDMKAHNNTLIILSSSSTMSAVKALPYACSHAKISIPEVRGGPC
jgi:hypothetical protein